MNLLTYSVMGILTISAILLALFFFTELGRYAKTVYLIARVSPYEQPGGGAGRVLILGDSTGYGTGARRSEDSIAGRFGANFTWLTMKNNSVNGRKIAGATEVATTLGDAQYSLIVLQIGANDLIGGRSADAVVRDMDRLIRAVLPHANEIVIISAGNIGAAPAFSGAEADRLTAEARAYTSAMLELTRNWQNVSYVDLFDEPEADPFVLEPETYLSLDGLHPSSAGYGIWYEKAKPALEMAIE